MTDLSLRPQTDSLLRAWGQMIEREPRGPGYDLTRPRQAIFEERIEEFCANPTAESFDAIWTTESAVEHSNPGGPLLRSSFDGDIGDLATFVESVRTAAEYDSGWEDQFSWLWALWELYSRSTDSVPVVVHSEASDALSWFGVSCTSEFRDLSRTLEQFADLYQSTIGRPTRGTQHDVSVGVEIDELFRATRALDGDDIAAQLKGPYGEFYRFLYGGSESASNRTEAVQLTGGQSIVRAYAWGKANEAYDKAEKPSYWGGAYWENWKESYASHVHTEIRQRFTLDDLAIEDIEPFFEALTNAEASELSKPVATYVMGSQWGQYTWSDIVDHFTANPIEASQVLSLFFDDSVPVVDRLEAFKEHTIHLTETEDRSPGSIERMATSLLMFTDPEDHLGLPPARTKQFLESTSSLPKYESGFVPRQYRTIIGPLRDVRDDIRQTLDERDVDAEVSMLDVHSAIWIFGGEGAPSESERPPEDW